jgi:hypothetical protein
VYVAKGNVDPTDPDAPRRLVNDEPLVVENNTKLSFAAQDAENNWSQIVSLDLVNQLRKHEIRIPLQRSLGDQAVTFVFPVDADSFTVVCRTLIARSLEVKIASASDLAARLQALVDDLKAGR